MPIPPSLADRPGALLVIAARTGQELARRRLKPMGLSVQMCGVLNLLAQGPISQQELGDQLGIDRTTVFELIDDLEARGAVVRKRNPKDRRSYTLHLTPGGARMQKRAARAFDAAADEFFAPLKSTDRSSLAEMLRKVISSADRHLKELSS